MEIHHPEHKLRSVRDFAFHIFTVTIGILIALALEALVNAQHARTVANHARRDFRDEFQRNRTAILADETTLLATQREVEGLIAYGQARQAHKQATLPDISAARSFAFANTTAWETALATQALLPLSFAETRAVTAATTRQSAFNTLQDRAEQQWFELAAYGNPGTIPDDQISGALQKVTIAYAYLRSVETMEKSLVETYDKALKTLPQTP